MRRMGGLARMVRVLLLAGLALAVLPAGSALADTTIGQTGGDRGCSPLGGTVVADTNYVVPAGGGTITSFSFQSDPTDSGIQLDFLVLRPTATAGSYTVVGKTEATLQGTGPEEFTASPAIAVQGNDIIGFWASTSFLTPCLFSVTSGGGLTDTASNTADPSVGDPVSFIFSHSDFDVNESANFVPALPTSKDQCKNGGWQSFGTLFKNQGDCVSFVASGGKNQPTG